MDVLRRFLGVATVAAGALALTACQLPIDTSGYAQGTGPGGSSLEGVAITNQYPDGLNATSVYSGSGTEVSVTPLPGANGNEREAFWFSNSPVAQNEQSCSTWDADPGFSQLGEMLHMTRSASGAVRGIAVVDNVWGKAKWLFNVYAIPGNRKSQIKSIKEGFDLSSVVGGKGDLSAPLPWHECARTFDGQIQFVVWTGTNPQPAYGTPGTGGSVAIPSAYANPGIAGWYDGHVVPGETARVSSLTSTTLSGPDNRCASHQLRRSSNQPQLTTGRSPRTGCDENQRSV
jgi:hypothetical protein